MRLHRLSMTAFGAFADTTTVDFDALAAEGLFLLHGPTGAGKTTILDAISFALYGRVPGARNDAKRLRSDHAQPQIKPVVELEATLSGQRVVLKRSPAFDRPKVRGGTGTTKEQPKATLRWLDNSRPALTRLDEIGEEIRRLVGLSADQFFQLALLPQGEFAKFIQASTDERAKVLEQLFAVERFDLVEKWLRDQRKQLSAKRDARVVGVERAAASLAHSCDVDAPIEPTCDWAYTLVEQVRDQRICLESAVSQRQEQHAAMQRELDRARSIATCQRRGVAALAALSRLDDREAEVVELRAELEAARQAATIAPLLAAADAATEAAATAAAVSDQASERLCHHSGAHFADEVALQDLLDDWKLDVTRLAAAADEQARLAKLEDDRTARRKQVEALRADSERLTKARRVLPDVIAETETALEADRVPAGTLSALTSQLAQAESARAAAQRVVELAALERAARDAHVAARERHADSRDEVHRLRVLRHEGMAAELALNLVDGQPCGVCGAPEHPAPATATGEPVTEAMEEQAAKHERRAAAAVDAAAVELGRLQTQLAIQCALAGDQNAAQWTAECGRLRLLQTQASEAEHRVVEVSTRLVTLRGELATITSEQSDIAAELARTEQSVSNLDEQCTRIRLSINNIVGEGVDAARKAADLVRAIKLGEAALAAVTDKRRRAEERASAHAVLADHLEGSGFVDAETARSAIRTVSAIERMVATLDSYSRERAVAAATLAETEVAAALTEPAVEMDNLERELSAAQAAHTSAVQQLAAAVQTERLAGEAAADLSAAFDRLHPVLVELETLCSVADLVAGGGQNSLSMSLRSYVLAARLEEVADAASLRLLTMSEGRYEFEHSDAREGHGRRGGLGLRIQDGFTGESRPVGTLSGGELFLASLALALGLADVVSAESGGAMLETMFIDEGFGSLDTEETLTTVMDVLDELRDGGRVIGVVSHVEEMRQRIPSRLRVVRGQQGSRVELSASA